MIDFQEFINLGSYKTPTISFRDSGQPYVSSYDAGTDFWFGIDKSSPSLITSDGLPLELNTLTFVTYNLIGFQKEGKIVFNNQDYEIIHVDSLSRKEEGYTILVVQEWKK